MKCLIDKSVAYSLRKGKKAEVIRRYIRMKYRINMDLGTIKERIKQMTNNQLELT
ncbi:hypothetical protein [Fulvivirga sp. M361]|uniref:hypothetical protein n=1 Tax=Fulvivirga sp. M361 TaxID=2594266 RepID=UPI00162A9604|nr:hypothetical protein [Fulvivirga sp. M361]